MSEQELAPDDLEDGDIVEGTGEFIDVLDEEESVEMAHADADKAAGDAS